MRLLCLLFAVMAGCGGAPKPAVLPKPEPVKQRRWCVALMTEKGNRYDVCTRLRFNCNFVRAGAFNYGRFGDITQIGECEMTKD